VWGALAQLVTGIALAAPLRGADPETAPANLVVKLVIAVLIAVMVVFSRKRERVNTGHFAGIIVLTLANAAVATFWTS
jgi:predicted permease